jgi:YVTN family beta-propeller protein
MKTVLLCAMLFSVLLSAESSLLILHKADSSLGFYTMDGKMTARVPVGKHPHEMVRSTDGKLLYITDNGTMRIEQAGTGGNTVSIVDLAARKKIGEISLGKFHRPHGIDLDPKTGRLVVSAELPDQLLLIDPVKRQTLKTYDTKGKTDHMAIFGPGGRFAYVCHSNSGDVAAVDLTSGAVTLVPAGTRPEGSVLSADGKTVYVVNRESSNMTWIDTATNKAVATLPTGKGAVRIAITPDGKTLAYALMHDEAVQFMDAATRKILGTVKIKGNPVSMSVSSDGKRAYCSAEEIDTVYVISVPDRKILRQFKTAAGYHPDPVMEID